MNGMVLDRGTRLGVDALVSAWRPGDVPGSDAPLATASTGPDGQFRLGGAVGLPARREVVVRVHLDGSNPEPDPRRLVAVVQLSPADQHARPVILVDPDHTARRLFCRALDEAGRALPARTVTVHGLPGDRPWQTVALERGGWLALRIDGQGEQPLRLRLWSGSGDSVMAADWAPADGVAEAELAFVPAGTFSAAGTVLRADGSPVPEVKVELLDRAGAWPNPVAVASSTDAQGRFALRFGRALETAPEPAFAVWSGDQRIALFDIVGSWPDGVLPEVQLTLDLSGDDPLAYVIDGQVLNRRARTAVAGARVEAWSGDATTMLKAADSDADGRFQLSLRPAPGAGPPALTLRAYLSGARVAEQELPASAWSGGRATAFIEADVPRATPEAFRIAGRLLDPATRTGIPGLRVEAWDKAPRTGGMIGVGAHAALDGTFDLVLPAASGATPPTVFFRVYAKDVLLTTADSGVAWDSNGTGVAVIDVPGVPAEDAGEVVLHELGETIAAAVNRMQRELDRYPTTLGAYLVDELDLSVPVAVQLDRLGQVRAKVVDRAGADEQLGQIHLRVRPVIGAGTPRADQLDQPLSVLPELSADAAAKLRTLRVYSVEDLARLAQVPAGREALEKLALGVNLDQLLDKVALLAIPTIPRPVREALIRLGVASTRAFVADPDPAGLATRLSQELGQAITEAAIRAWQQRAGATLRIPLPDTNG